jgi:hypothetical protein
METTQDRIDEVVDPDMTLPIYGGLGPMTSRLVHVLSVGVDNEELTDDDLEVIADCPMTTTLPMGSGKMTNPRYGCFLAAVKFVEKEYGLVWRRVPRAGVVKCCDASGKVRVLTKAREKRYRDSKRSVIIGHSVDTSALSKTERIRHSAELRSAQMSHVVHSMNMMNQIESASPKVSEDEITADRLVKGITGK